METTNKVQGRSVKTKGQKYSIDFFLSFSNICLNIDSGFFVYFRNIFDLPSFTPKTASPPLLSFSPSLSLTLSLSLSLSLKQTNKQKHTFPLPLFYTFVAKTIATHHTHTSNTHHTHYTHITYLPHTYSYTYDTNITHTSHTHSHAYQLTQCFSTFF